MGTFWPRSSSVERDNDDERAIGALAYFFEPGTTTPKPVYQDAAETNAHEHPLETDGNGRWPAVFIPFGSGSYKVLITTAGGTTLFASDDIPNAAPVEADSGITEGSAQALQTGQILFSLANETFAGFVRCNGRTIGSAASTATERANADTENLFTYIWNKSITLRATVSGGPGATAAADFAANKTIALPNGRGATLTGFDDMGNTDSGNSDSAPVVSGSSILAGSLIGANTHTILEAQLPTHAHSVSITSGAGSAHTHGLGTLATVGAGAHTHSGTTGTESANHVHEYNSPNYTNGYAGGAGPGSNSSSVAQTTFNLTGHTHSFSTTSDPGNHTHTFSGALANESSHTHSVSGNTGNIGSGTAHNIMALSLPVTVLIKL